MGTWAEEELGGASLGDVRLTKRLIRLADCLADKPTSSIPGARKDWAETKAAYRFFDREKTKKKEKVRWDSILQPHFDNTEVRIRQHPVVRCLQGTTDRDFNGQGMMALGRSATKPNAGCMCIPPLLSRRNANLSG